jgi:hypothetical protein
MNKTRTQQILLAFVLAAFCALEFHKILVLGKNADGVEYAAVGRNMAEGYGTFWKPYLDDYHYPVHHEQPPLFYGIQAVFFRLFGDGDYFEGIYGFAVGCVLLALTALLWRRVRSDFGMEAVGSWWPILLLLTITQFLYILQTNKIMPTFMIFALLSVYFAYLSLSPRPTWVVHAALSGIFIYLGFLTKGPFALFALFVPAAGLLAFRTPLSRTLARTSVPLVIFAGIFSLTLLVSEDSRTLWKEFFNNQILTSLNGEREAGPTRYANLFRFLSQMFLPLGLLTLSALLLRVKPRINRQAAFFLLIALASGLPLFLFPRQKIRYMLHAFPFLMIGLALAFDLVAARIESWVHQRRRLRTGLELTAAVAFIGAVMSMVAMEGKVTKEPDFFHDIYLKDLGIPERGTMSVVPDDLIYMYGDHLFQYMQRYLKVSVTGELGHDYLLVKSHYPWPIPEEYEQISFEPIRNYRIFRKRK